MRRLFWLIPIALFFLNPGLGCVSPDEPDFHYGAAEMRAAIAGTWGFTITPSGGTAMAVTVQLDEADKAPVAAAQAAGRSLIRAAHACGSRTLVKSAGACIDSTSMPLAVTFISGDPSLTDTPSSGRLTVFGTAFQSGDLELTIGPYQISAGVGPDGTVGSTYLYVAGQGATGTVTATHS